MVSQHTEDRDFEIIVYFFFYDFFLFFDSFQRYNRQAQTSMADPRAEAKIEKKQLVSMSQDV